MPREEDGGADTGDWKMRVVRPRAVWAVRSEKSRPAQEVKAQAGKQEAVGSDPTDGLQHAQGFDHKVGSGDRGGQCYQGSA